MPNWNLLLSSATIIAGCAFLVRFFGGIITDQIPFNDDRKWAIDLFGVIFFIKVLAWSIIGFAVAYYFRIPLEWQWSLVVDFIALFLITSWLNISNSVLGQRYYSLKSTLLTRLFPRNDKNLALRTLQLDPLIPSESLIIVASYAFTGIYLIGHTGWILAATIEVFACALSMALRESYRILQKPSVATIHLSDGQVLSNVALLKVNPTNVRIRKDETVKIINMSHVKWIETNREG